MFKSPVQNSPSTSLASSFCIWKLGTTEEDRGRPSTTMGPAL